MRDFLGFLLFLTVIFFVVGEWQGWYLGIAGQTPVFVYKKDAVAQTERRTINIDTYPVDLTGRVRHGTVKVEVVFEDAGSFQAGRAGTGSKELYEEEFRQGQQIVLRQTFSEGRGNYIVRLSFDDATGLFRMPAPKLAEL